MEKKEEDPHRVAEYERAKLQEYDEKETNFLMQGIDQDAKIVIKDKFEKDDNADADGEAPLSSNAYLQDEL